MLDDYTFRSVAGSIIIHIVTFFLFYLLSLVTYRVFLHPLSRYPGPFLAKVTDLYSVYHTWKGDRHLDFYRNHEIYGPVFRYGPNRLSYNTSTALRSIYGTKANVRKGDFYNMLSVPTGPNILSAIPKDVHARKKRVLSSAFNDKALISMEEYMLIHIRTFCATLAKSKEVLNMAEWLPRMTGNILGELCFGRSFEMLEKEDNRFVIGLMSEALRYGMVCGSTIPLFKFRIAKYLFRDFLGSRTRYRNFAIAQAVARTALPSESRKDFYHFLMETKNPDTNEKYRHVELWVEANVLLIAGSDTTSMALASSFFYLTHNPKALEKAVSEVRAVFQGRDIEAIRSGPELDSCKYLRACIDESMRMTPPVPGILPRVVLEGGIEIDGTVVPKGTEVGVSTYTIHHNETYFPDSFEFRPERWLPNSKHAASKEAHSAFVPFSLGPRTCIGKNMAYIEMMITMARVLRMFDMKSVGTIGEGASDLGNGRQRKGEFQAEDVFICKLDGPMVEFRVAS